MHMNTSMRNGLLAIGLLVIAGVAVGAYLQFGPGQEVATEQSGQVAGAVNYDAIPDGTPETADVKLNETKTVMGARINPLQVVEDSRCPTDVKCVQAGTVRVRALVAARGDADAATQEVVFEVGTPMTVGQDQITLIAVKPDPKSATKIAAGDYVFTFSVVKGAGEEYFKG